MASLEFTIKSRYSRGSSIKSGQKSPKKVTIEFDADKFEKLAALFGLFNPEFLKELDESEKDYKEGRFRKIKSLKDLRKK